MDLQLFVLWLSFHTTGFCNTLVGHPIDLIKVRVQTRSAVRPGKKLVPPQTLSSSTFRELQSILAKEGLPGLYKGVTAPLLAVVPAFSVTFYSYDTARNFLLCRSAHSDDKLTILETTLAGGFSGLPLGLVLGPTERLKCLMQVGKNKYGSFLDCAKQVYAEGGMQSVLRGTGATVMRDVPGNAAYFAMYESSRRAFSKLEGRDDPSLRATFLAGGLAGISNWIVAIPFDVVKSRFQTDHTYKNLTQVLVKLLRQEGAGALFRGIAPALIRAFYANAACLAGVETARSVLFPRSS